MNRATLVILVCVLLGLLEAVAASAAAFGPNAPVAAPAGGRAAAPDPLADAPVVCLAKITRVQYGPVAQSMPPIYNVTLTVSVVESLRGGLAVNSVQNVSYAARQNNQPRFDQNLTYVIGGRPAGPGEIQASIVQPANDAALANLRRTASMALGWSTKDDKLVSPWAALGSDAWPKDATAPADAQVCSVTGRPMLRVDAPGVVLKVEPVPPVQEIEWTNPDGDGLYKITVTNTTNRPVEVRPLLSDALGNILWKESLVVVCQGKAQPAPGCAPVKAAPQSTRLEPNQSVSTELNILQLKDIEWPQGAYRIEFTFCLGELAETKSFYYHYRHHDGLRAKANQ
jgi:hypothetical protein